MLTPYEFGRETGKLQARINREEVSKERIKQLAELLGIEERIGFEEGYRNGFEEVRVEEREARIDAAYLEMVEDEDPPWLPRAEELEAAEIELTARELEESQQAYREMVEDEYPIGYSIFSWLRD